MTHRSTFLRCRSVCLSALTLSLSCLRLTLLSDWVTIFSFTVSVGNKVLYKMEINQIMLKSPVCGCVTNLGCPYNLSQMMTEEGNKGAYSHHHCHSESRGASEGPGSAQFMQMHQCCWRNNEGNVFNMARLAQEVFFLFLSIDGNIPPAHPSHAFFIFSPLHVILFHLETHKERTILTHRKVCFLPFKCFKFSISFLHLYYKV